MSSASKKPVWVGFDLGGTKMLSVVYDASFRPVGRKRRKTKANEGVRAGTERIVQTIQESLAEAAVDPASLAGIGIGCPGPLDLDQGMIVDAPNLGWHDVPIKALLEKKFGCPVVIANDVDAGVYGEYRLGAAKKERCVLGIFPGTGIGGGCVYEGKIFRGKRSSCMEIGHIQVVPNGPQCGCGRHGCLEAVASRLAVSAAAAQAAIRGDAPNLLALAGTDLTNIRSGALASAIKAGDRVVEQIVHKAAGHIGTLLGGLVNLLAPDCVVMGGGLVEAMPELIVSAVDQAARKSVLPNSTMKFKVVAAQLGDDATAIGAAGWAQDVVTSK